MTQEQLKGFFRERVRARIKGYDYVVSAKVRHSASEGYYIETEEYELHTAEEVISVESDPVYWTAPVGGFDDFDAPITDTFIDGKTTDGPWALMTPDSWAKYGAYKVLGTGRGQKYVKQADGRWLKTEG